MFGSGNGTAMLLQTMLLLINQQDNNTVSDSNTYYHVEIGEENLAERCYGIYGCFQISSPWTSESRPVSMYPESPDKIRPNYLMYTRQNKEVPHYLDVNDPDVVEHSNIDPELPIFFISHGYMEAGNRPWIHRMAVELLEHQPCTVIAVDWHGGSSPPYTQAVANIRLVGAITAHLLAEISQITGPKKLDHVHLIGHSLGAHLSGYVGYTLQNDFGLTVGRITGLDPAEPHFAKSVPQVRLDRSAAKYVDIVHTDASGFVKGGFGIIESIGHVDYYPNGGLDQPGCSDGVFQHIAAEQGSFFMGVKKYISCNHVRSHQFFTESIRSPCKFTTIRCGSYEHFKNGECFECNKRGQFCIKFGLEGIHSYRALEEGGRIEKGQQIQTYFMTSSEPQFCRGHYRVTVTLSNSTDAIRHGGEIGILWVKIHGTSGSTSRISLRDTEKFYAPGKTYMNVLPGEEVGVPISATLEWEFKTSFVNPLTWRLLSNPRIYISTVIVESLETGTRLKLCPGSNREFSTNLPKKLLPTYCKYH